jgi:hypothetical protein
VGTVPVEFKNEVKGKLIKLGLLGEKTVEYGAPDICIYED